MAGKRHTRSHFKVNRKRKRVSVYVYAAILRKKMTKAEVVLWSQLKLAMREWNVSFESQGVVLCRFIGDFVCYDKRLVIEVDGPVHNRASVKRKDAFRESLLKASGYRILRFENKEVLTNCRKVLDVIRTVVLQY